MLRKRIGILKRIKQKIPADKLSIIADAIFNSVIRYGIAVYLVPTYEKEDLKARKLCSETNSLQIIQNGGFQLLDLIIPELKSHVIPYKFKCSHWWKINL